MADPQRPFVPAAGHDWLLPLYDPVQKLLGGDAARAQLIEQASIEPGHCVLDVGCGTGDLVVQVKLLHPEAIVVGLDPDPKALARASAKADRAGTAVRLERGFADDLPFADASFDRVVSSFMFHHLDLDVKRGMLAEIRRVLAPGGSLHLLDFGGTGDTHGGLLARLLHAHEHLRDNLGDRPLELMRDAGLSNPRQVGRRRTIFGTIAFLQAGR